MASFPPFPSNLPTVPLTKISYEKLLAKDSAAAEALLDAAEGSGFFLLDFSATSGAGFTLADLAKGFDIGKEFFDGDLETKKLFSSKQKSLGYSPPGLIQVAPGVFSKVEIAGVPRDSIRDENAELRLPAAFEGHREFMRTMTEKLHRVAVAVFECLERGLEVAPGSLVAPHELTVASATQMRFLHYQAEPVAQTKTLLGHTDSGSLTILFTNLGGLQVLPPGKREEEGNWEWVKPEPGCAIVNIADALVAWSGRVLRSGFHRVVASPGEQATFDRYSWGYFLKPANEANMARISGGSVIPKPTAAEAKDESEMPSYVEWHKYKHAATIEGRNDVKSLGGIRRQTQAVSA